MLSLAEFTQVIKYEEDNAIVNSRLGHHTAGLDVLPEDVLMVSAISFALPR